MKRMIAFSLALALVAAGAPALAHEANYPGECDERKGGDQCEQDDSVKPAHDKCTGVRNHMWTDDGSIVKESLGLALSEDASVSAYIHTDTDDGGGEGAAALMPGIVWLETNGFSGLQRTGFECTSDGHDDPKEWQTHADKILI